MTSKHEQKVPARTKARGRESSSLSPCSLADVGEAVKVSWTTSEAFTPETIAVYSKVLAKFAVFAEASGARTPDEVTEEIVRSFMSSRRAGGDLPANTTALFRAQAVRAFFKEARRLGLAASDPTMDISLPRLQANSGRPLTDREVELCRRYALDSATSLRRPLTWALAEAGGRPLEIAQLRVADVDMGSGEIIFRGTDKYGARRVPLTDWGHTQVARRMESKRKPTPDDLLIAWRFTEIKAPRSAAGMAVTETLKAAGLQEESAVRPHSVGLWRGTCWLIEGRTIDEVAWLLGYRCLDTAAAALGFEWWNR